MTQTQITYGDSLWLGKKFALVPFPRLSPRPYMVKPFEVLLLWKQNAYNRAPWYVATHT